MASDEIKKNDCSYFPLSIMLFNFPSAFPRPYNVYSLLLPVKRLFTQADHQQVRVIYITMSRLVNKCVI